MPKLHLVHQPYIVFIFLIKTMYIITDKFNNYLRQISDHKTNTRETYYKPAFIAPLNIKQNRIQHTNGEHKNPFPFPFIHIHQSLCLWTINGPHMYLNLPSLK